MNNFRYLLVPTIALACGAPTDENSNMSSMWYAQTPEWARDIPVPGQEGRVDGSVWNDGMFQTEKARQEFCAEWKDTPEAWFCSEVGQLEHSWKSSEYHGVNAITGDNDGACYGPNSVAGSGDCIFPEMKHVRIITTSIDCYQGDPPPDGPSLLQEQAILFGIAEGILMWDNVGGNVGTPTDIVMDGTPGTEWYAPLKITCRVPDAGVYAVGGLSGQGKKRVNNLPVGPHSGKDLDQAYVIKEMWVDVNVNLIWQDAKNVCPSGQDVSTLDLRKFSWSIGIHEGGHDFGFAHFLSGGNMSNNVMYPWRNSRTCLQSWNILTDYKEAMGYLDTPSAGGVSVVDHGLQNEQPQ